MPPICCSSVALPFVHFSSHFSSAAALKKSEAAAASKKSVASGIVIGIVRKPMCSPKAGAGL